MKMFSKFFTLILCLELIVSPITPSLSFLGQKAFAADCPAGLQFDSTLNRCLTPAQTANVLNATMSCPQDDVECYKRNAQNAFQDKVNAGEAPERKGGGGFVSKIANIAAIAGPVTYAVIGMSSSQAKCASPSFYGMVAGALAVVVGDNWANYEHKKRLKDIKEDWGKIVNPEEAGGDKDKIRETNIEAQSEAFEMLARAEDSLADAAKKKKMFFMAATLAYGVTAAISAMEILKNKSLKAAAITASKTSFASSTTLTTSQPSVKTAASAVAVAAGKDEGVNAQLVANPLPEAASSLAGINLATIAGSAKAMTTAASLAAADPANVAGGAGVAAAANAASAATAAEAWATHTATITCIPVGSATVKTDTLDSKSIYAYYLSGKPLDIRAELQLRHNLENSENLAAFVMNKREMEGKVDSPLEEYEEYKTTLGDIEDKSIFEMFKAVSMVVLNNLSPLPFASAREEVQENDRLLETDGGSDGGGPPPSRTANKNSEVNTNAAKAFKEDKAKGIDLMSIGLGVGIGVLLGIKREIGAKLISSKGRLIFSGVMAALTLKMALHAGSQAEASKKRAELLRKMKEEFNVASGAVFACKSEDRNDPGKPNCYCYTPENQRNPNRGSSQVCQNLWAGKSFSATNYLANGKTSSRICISNQNKADPTCACKQTKTCMKVGMGGISGLNPGTMSVLSTGLAPINGIANGSIDAANIDSAALENAAARVKKLNEQLAKKGLGIKDRKKAEDKLMKALTRGAAGLPSGNLLGSSSSSNLPSNPGDAARMLEKELENSNAPTGIGGGGNFLAAPVTPIPEQGFEFGLTPDQLAAQETQIAELMNQDLDYGSNDINEGSNVNIFEVLSNRYQRSGMRRLFDEEGKIEADKPAETDIIQ